MVYNFTFAPPEDCSIALEDRNSSGSLGNHDEVACNAHSRSNLGGTTDSLPVPKPLLRIAKHEERQGD